MEEKNVKVEFVQEHLGHNVGSTKIVGSSLANQLASLGVVIVHELVEHVVHKSMDSPPSNKMISKPVRKKSI